MRINEIVNSSELFWGEAVAKYILVGLELPLSQRSPRQGREAELSPLQSTSSSRYSRAQESRVRFSPFGVREQVCWWDSEAYKSDVIPVVFTRGRTPRQHGAELSVTTSRQRGAGPRPSRRRRWRSGRQLGEGPPPRR
jgi:hypothetical protein